MIARLEPFFVWMQDSAVSAYFLENTWSSPIVQCAHLLALGAGEHRLDCADAVALEGLHRGVHRAAASR